MAQIGLKNLYYALITEDANGNETYGSPVRLAKAISAEINVNTDDSTLWADDGADVVVKEFINGTITLGVSDLENGKAATLLGASIDANGVMLSGGEDTPPAVAIGFQSRSAKGGDRFFWLYRVVFAVPNQALNTKGETIEFSTPSIVGTISRRNKEESNGKHLWKADVKAGESGVTATTITNWFNAVYIPGSTNDAVLSTMSLTNTTLDSAFDADKTEYTGTASNTSGTLAVTAPSGTGIVVVANGFSTAINGSITWKQGENVIKITADNGTAQKTYTITVTKS